ncbi:hypothetical protein AB834_04775 [PVC group bacterium (ex Bugula neritina AB1)]|nr:hypothetical protein AB834_04775 [PVC group bacterium (ex Bugula neritina AB1)]
MEKLKIWRIVLFFVCVVLVTYIASYYKKSFDLTKEKMFTLSDKTKHILNSLDGDVEIVAFVRKERLIYTQIKRLLEQYQQKSSLILVNYVDPIKDVGQSKILASKYGFELKEEIVLVRHKYKTQLLRLRDIAVYDYSPVNVGMPPQLQSFSGEAAISGAIFALQNPKKKTLHFVTGHGEKSVGDSGKEGLLSLKNLLLKQNLEVKPLHLVNMKKEEVKVEYIVIPGGSYPLTDAEVKILTGFLKEGGRLIVLLDSQQQTNLIPWLKDYNVGVGDDIIVDPQFTEANTSLLNLLTINYEKHPLTEKMYQVYTKFVLPRSTNALSLKSLYQASPLTKTSLDAWGETDYRQTPYMYDKKKDNVGPLSVGVSSENVVTGSRLVVWGDSDFISNQFINFGGNKYLFLNTVRWLMEQEELISIPAKTLRKMSLPLTERQLKNFNIWLFFVIPCGWFICGIFVFFLRQK